MKNVIFLIIASFMIILTGCCTYDGYCHIKRCCPQCGYPTDCWKGYFKRTFCGTYVQSPCEKLCDHCTFNEPSCRACWQCVKQDGCGFGDIPLGDDCAAIRSVQ